MRSDARAYVLKPPVDPPRYPVPRASVPGQFKAAKSASPPGVNTPLPCSPVNKRPVACPTLTGRSHRFPLISMIPQ